MRFAAFFCVAVLGAANSVASLSTHPSGYTIDLTGRVAFVAGVADPSGLGWAIAKSLHKAGATVLAGTWVFMVNRFEHQMASGAYDGDRVYKTPNGDRMLSFDKIYAIDVAYDTFADIPQSVKEGRLYASMLAAGRKFSIADVAAAVTKDYGRLDFLIHSIANGKEVGKPLLETSRDGYKGAVESSAYSLVSLIQNFVPLLSKSDIASVVSLTYIASQAVIPGYGGGMSSAKAALESDTKTLAYEAGRQYGIRVNAISAGPHKTRAAGAIKKPGEKKSFIDFAIKYSKANASLRKDLRSDDVGDAALFLLSPMSRGVSGVTLFVDNGMHSVGMAADSASLLDDPQ